MVVIGLNGSKMTAYEKLVEQINKSEVATATVK